MNQGIYWTTSTYINISFWSQLCLVDLMERKKWMFSNSGGVTNGVPIQFCTDLHWLYAKRWEPLLWRLVEAILHTQIALAWLAGGGPRRIFVCLMISTVWWWICCCCVFVKKGTAVGHPWFDSQCSVKSAAHALPTGLSEHRLVGTLHTVGRVWGTWRVVPYKPLR